MPAFSYSVACKYQAEIDGYRNKLLEVQVNWPRPADGQVWPVLADCSAEDWRDPEAFHSNGCDDEAGEVSHRHARGRVAEE